MQLLPTDQELVQQSKEGNMEAFSKLVDKYRQKVFQTSMGFLHNVEDAEDLTQDIFVKVWRSIKSFDQRSSFSTWLYRIAVNRAINEVRKNKLKSFIGLNNEVKNSNYTLDNAETQLVNQEQKKQIRQAINQLKTNQRKAFILFYYQELSMREVASVMKISPKAAESLVFRARKKLQKVLSRQS
ncbi:RNA polymerase sigma factor [Thermophagus sp. OGC60D27]|uniref:RNA polymerase sigma factor n=1 Tax=Thermophagus sp. OGC60D27 TaxID=3458415 RepID=UPI0040375F5B